ncbi:S8 family serine peptidase [uncultured Shewanella sp.]|uniref:S8 family serine peptidase n=1 Tax=uncultured Shewanella sp. TaxID=173975 RepID=UPI00262284D6|nr:S8 family serine peptidase [uncultured Shewanella sp.]
MKPLTPMFKLNALMASMTLCFSVWANDEAVVEELKVKEVKSSKSMQASNNTGSGSQLDPVSLEGVKTGELNIPSLHEHIIDADDDDTVEDIVINKEEAPTFTLDASDVNSADDEPVEEVVIGKEEAPTFTLDASDVNSADDEPVEEVVIGKEEAPILISDPSDVNVGEHLGEEHAHSNEDEFSFGGVAYECSDAVEADDDGFTDDIPLTNDPFVCSQENLDEINVQQAWDHTTGDQTVIVGIIGQGVDYDHDDLKANMWTNANERKARNAKQKDYDRNGYPNDVHGYDAVNDDGDPLDLDLTAENDYMAYGSAVAGVIGAAGNNNLGIAGINWNVSMIACQAKEWNSQLPDMAQYAEVDHLIACVDYFVALKENEGVDIKAINMSLGMDDYDDNLKYAIDRATEAGMLIVAAAGDNAGSVATNEETECNINDLIDLSEYQTKQEAESNPYLVWNRGRVEYVEGLTCDDIVTDEINDTSSDIAVTPFYPASFNHEAIISVTSVDDYGEVSSFANWSVADVDLAAPGEAIFSTAQLGDEQHGYQYFSGTSMAAAHVTGAAALLWSFDSNVTAAEMKQILMDSVDSIESLQDKTVSGGRLNVGNALERLMDSNEPDPVAFPVEIIQTKINRKGKYVTQFSWQGAEADDSNRNNWRDNSRNNSRDNSSNNSQNVKNIEIYRDNVLVKTTIDDGLAKHKFTSDELVASTEYKVCHLDMGCSAPLMASFDVPSESDEPIVVDVLWSKINKRGQYVTKLSWSGPDTEKVDIYKDGDRVKTTQNDGMAKHKFIPNDVPVTSAVYQVCVKGTSYCSEPLTAYFEHSDGTTDTSTQSQNNGGRGY